MVSGDFAMDNEKIIEVREVMNDYIEERYCGVQMDLKLDDSERYKKAVFTVKTADTYFLETVHDIGSYEFSRCYCNGIELEMLIDSLVMKHYINFAVMLFEESKMKNSGE